MAGAGTNAVTVIFSTDEAQTIAINYVDQNGCTATDLTVKNVVVNPLPVPTITDDAKIWIGRTNTYSTEAAMTGYEWTISAGGTIATGLGTNTVTVEWLSPGWQTIGISYINANGCIANAAILHKMKVIYPPIRSNEAISMNGDGLNDLLIFNDLNEYPRSKLLIYTRAGQNIYSSEDYQNDWDGKILRKSTMDMFSAINGVYYYVLKLGITKIKIKGFVYISN